MAAILSSPPGLTVTGARRKRTGVLVGDTSQMPLQVAGHAGPQASDRMHVHVRRVRKAGAAHWRQAGRTSRPSNRLCPGECLGTHSGTYLGFTWSSKKICRSFKCQPVIAGVAERA